MVDSRPATDRPSPAVDTSVTAAVLTAAAILDVAWALLGDFLLVVAVDSRPPAAGDRPSLAEAAAATGVALTAAAILDVVWALLGDLLAADSRPAAADIPSLSVAAAATGVVLVVLKGRVACDVAVAAVAIGWDMVVLVAAVRDGRADGSGLTAEGAAVVGLVDCLVCAGGGGSMMYPVDGSLTVWIATFTSFTSAI
jgi:hypothetical protein